MRWLRQRWLPGLVLALGVLVLSACGVAAADSWPGMTVSGDRIYLSHGANVYAVDLKSGQQIWKLQSANGPIYAPVTVVNDKLYVGTFNGQALTLNPQTGAVIGGPANVVDRVFAAATIGDGIAYFAATNFVRALDASNLADKGINPFETQRNVYAQPLLISGTLYVASLDGNVYALDPATLKEKWHAPVGGAVGDTPRQVGNTLIFGGFDKRVHVLDLGQQKIIWTSDQQAGWIWGTPAVGPDGTIYATGLVEGNANAGEIYAFKPPSAQPVWKITTDSSVRAGPVLSEDNKTLYVVTQGGLLLALDATQNGKELWRAQPDPVNGTPPRLLATPVIANGTIYVAPSDGNTLIYGYPLAGGNHQPTVRFVPPP